MCFSNHQTLKFFDLPLYFLFAAYIIHPHSVYIHFSYRKNRSMISCDVFIPLLSCALKCIKATIASIDVP